MEIQNKQKENTFANIFKETIPFNQSLNNWTSTSVYNLSELNQEQLLFIGLLELKIFRDENNFYVETDDFLIQKTLSTLKTKVIEEPIEECFLTKVKRFLKIIK